jgi:2-oxo-3-hexenedioate decarboxylase
MTSLEELARIVDAAAASATEIPQLTRTQDLTVEESYAIQTLSLARRQARGERRVGVKMGLTSRAKMQQVGVDEVIWGRLTDAMRVEEGGRISLSRYVHPRVEPELAFLMKTPLAGEVSAAEAMAAVAAIAPAMEIIDSRYQDFKFTLPDVVADNSSSSGFVIGSWVDPGPDFSNLGLIMEANGRAVQMGSTASILGHPVRSLVAAARMVGRSGERLESGWIVLAGGATAAHPLAPGMHIRTVFAGLGAVSFSVEE